MAIVGPVCSCSGCFISPTTTVLCREMSGNERRLVDSTRTTAGVPPASSEPEAPGAFNPARGIGYTPTRLMLIVEQGPRTMPLKPQDREDGGAPPLPGTSRRTRCSTLSIQTPPLKINGHMSCDTTFKRRESSVNSPKGPCRPSKSKTHVH